MLNPIQVVAAAGVVISMSGAAEAGERWVADRVEDRIDRRESILDERVDYGRRDVIEDRIDRRESYRDRSGKPTSRAVNRWERYSWKKRWGQN